MTDDTEGAENPFDIVPLGSQYLHNFDCGDIEINEWLVDRAILNEHNGSSRTWLLMRGIDVVGYYALSNGGIVRQSYISRLRHGLPKLVPAVLLGQLGVHKDCQGQSIGADLVFNALEKVVKISALSGVVAVHLHVRTEPAMKFWKRLGFRPAKQDTRVDPEQDTVVEMYLPIADATAMVAIRAAEIQQA